MPEREMEDYRAWRELALAVVVTAVEDYKAAIRAYKKNPCERTRSRMDSEENWFYSETCDMYLQERMTGLEIVRRIRKEMGLDAEDAE